MTKGRGILSPLRLPVPPLGQKIDKGLGPGVCFIVCLIPVLRWATLHLSTPRPLSAFYGLIIFADVISRFANPTWQLVVWL